MVIFEDTKCIVVGLFNSPTTINNTGALCDMGYLSETCIRFKPHDNPFLQNICFRFPLVFLDFYGRPSVSLPCSVQNLKTNVNVSTEMQALMSLVRKDKLWNNRSNGRWLETPRRSCDITVMVLIYFRWDWVVCLARLEINYDAGSLLQHSILIST